MQSAPQLSTLHLEQNRFGRAGREALHLALEGLLSAGRDIDFRPEELQAGRQALPRLRQKRRRHLRAGFLAAVLVLGFGFKLYKSRLGSLLEHFVLDRPGT